MTPPRDHDLTNPAARDSHVAGGEADLGAQARAELDRELHAFSSEVRGIGRDAAKLGSLYLERARMTASKLLLRLVAGLIALVTVTVLAGYGAMMLLDGIRDTLAAWGHPGLGALIAGLLGIAGAGLFLWLARLRNQAANVERLRSRFEVVDGGERSDEGATLRRVES